MNNRTTAAIVMAMLALAIAPGASAGTITELIEANDPGRNEPIEAACVNEQTSDETNNTVTKTQDCDGYVSTDNGGSACTHRYESRTYNATTGEEEKDKREFRSSCIVGDGDPPADLLLPVGL